MKPLSAYDILNRLNKLFLALVCRFRAWFRCTVISSLMVNGSKLFSMVQVRGINKFKFFFYLSFIIRLCSLNPRFRVLDLQLPSPHWSRDSSVGIATGYGLDGRGSISGRGKRVSLLHSHRTGSGAHPASSPWVLRALSSGLKLPGREADHSPPSIVSWSRIWSYTSSSPHVFMTCCLIN
jgi:hypothetical protein